MSLPGAMLTWQQATVLSAGLAAASTAVRVTRLGRSRTLRWLAPIGLEAALVSLLFAIWQLAHTLAITQTSGGVDRGKQIWSLERALQLPSETAIQRPFLSHPRLIEFSNLYYAGVHFPATIALLTWLFLRHRDRYRPVRRVLAVATALSLLIQLIPVAPPRLIPQFGMVDTALSYGQSVYGPNGTGIADQLGAMPSVHVLWAVLVAVVAVHVSSSRWRWLVVVHTALTVLVVVVTANHYWLDGIVAVGLLGAALLVEIALVQPGQRLRAARPASSHWAESESLPESLPVG